MTIQRKKTAQKGMTLVELLVALFILVFGMAAVMGMILTAVRNDNRTKHDTSATMLAQLVAEKISSTPGSQNPPPASAPPLNPLATDCTGAQFTIAIAGTAAGAGANVIPGDSGTPNAGNIDFVGQTYANVPANYKMLYTSCGAGGMQQVYEVRWNVRTISGFTKLVTVAARRANVGNREATFIMPATIRTIVSQ